MEGPTNRTIRAAVYCRVEHDGRDGDSSKKIVDGQEYDLKIRASTSRIARDGGIIEPHAWSRDLDAYRRNPVIMFAHYYGDPPVGTAVKTEVDESDGSLVQYVKWLDGITEDQWDQLAYRLRRLYEMGGMRTWSVGFNIKEIREPTPEEFALAAQLGEELRWVATRAELLETSAVPVPADKYADTLEKSFETAARKGLIDVAPLQRHWNEIKQLTSNGVTCSKCGEHVHPDNVRRASGAIVCVNCSERGAISFSVHGSYSVADKGATWDAGKEVGSMEASRSVLRPRHAYVDSDGDADAKSSYKFPHHRAGEGMAVVFRALANGFARLNQASISDEAKNGVASHLGRHYRKDFDEEPPEREALAEAITTLATVRYSSNPKEHVLWAARHGPTVVRLGGGDFDLGYEAIAESLPDLRDNVDNSDSQTGQTDNSADADGATNAAAQSGDNSTADEAGLSGTANDGAGASADSDGAGDPPAGPDDAATDQDGGDKEGDDEPAKDDVAGSAAQGSDDTAASDADGADDGADDDEEYYEFEVEAPEGIDPTKAVIDQIVGEFIEGLAEVVGQKSQSE